MKKAFVQKQTPLNYLDVWQDVSLEAPYIQKSTGSIWITNWITKLTFKVKSNFTVKSTWTIQKPNWTVQ